MNKEAPARVHVNELEPSTEERKLPEAADDNAELANHAEQVQPVPALHPEAANDNEVTDAIKISELKARLRLANEVVTPPEPANEVEPLQEVPSTSPAELERAIRTASLESSVGHAETLEDSQEKASAVQASGGAAKSGGGSEGGSATKDAGGSTNEKGSEGGDKKKGLLGRILKWPFKILKGAALLIFGAIGATFALSLAALKKTSEKALDGAKLGKSGNSGPKPKSPPAGGGHGADH